MGAGQKGKEGASSEQSKYPLVPSLLGDFPLRFPLHNPKVPGLSLSQAWCPLPCPLSPLPFLPLCPL